MAKLPRLYRFDVSDYPELNETFGFEGFVRNLNTTLETVYYAFNIISFGDNIRSQIWTGLIIPDNDLPLKVLKTFTGKAFGVTVEQVQENNKEWQTLTNPIQIGWRDEGENIKIYELMGATGATEYQVTLLIKGE